MNDNPPKVSDPLGDEGEEANGCCKTLKQIVAAAGAAIAGTIDNATGTNIRGSIASSGIIQDPDVAQTWNNTSDGIDVLSFIGGNSETGTGAAIMTTSVDVTAGSGGAAIEVSGPGMLAGGAMILHGQFTANNAIKNLSSQNGRVHIEQTNNSSGSSNNNSNQSKVEKSKKTESIGGGKYTKTTEVRPSKISPGQSRAEIVKYKNQSGKTIKVYKDSYDRGNNFQHRKHKLPGQSTSN